MFIKDLQTRISLVGFLMIQKIPPSFFPRTHEVMCIYIRIGRISKNVRAFFANPPNSCVPGEEWQQCHGSTRSALALLRAAATTQPRSPTHGELHCQNIGCVFPLGVRGSETMQKVLDY